jgi:RNA polymerase sigma factor (sigma-70 family)
MIVETLPKLGEEVKRIELYRAYTDNWILDQSRRKGARLLGHQRKQFARELAMKLYSENRLACHYKEFIPMLRQWFEIDDAVQMDYLRSDVQTCTFLVRDSEGNYRFRHRSFMEFFVAQMMAEEIRRGSPSSLGTVLLPLEVRSFLIDFLIDEPPSELLKQWLHTEEKILHDNVLSLLLRLKVNIDDTKLQDEPDKENEARIAAQFLQGNTQAFDLLYRSFKVPLMKYVRNVTRRNDLVEDIVIDVFLSVWLNRDRIFSVTSLKPYLFGVARNKCLDILRGERRFGERFEFSLDADESPLKDQLIDENLISPENALITEETISNALSRLRKVDRDILIGSVAEGKTYDELAREMNMDVTRVRASRYRSMSKLRDLLKKRSEH